ncbi:MAG: 30S ribosomal protein S20 [Candidatus Omnitrophica bacterium]|nr:30S ribosomal protein S20 [Candidatus Omnitrophota bacterium]
MPKRRAAVKRIRVDEKRHDRNVRIKRELKKTIKKFLALVTAKNAAEAKTMLVKVYSLLDKAAKKKIVHIKFADRRKSRLAKTLKKTS